MNRDHYTFEEDKIMNLIDKVIDVRNNLNKIAFYDPQVAKTPLESRLKTEIQILDEAIDALVVTK